MQHRKDYATKLSKTFAKHALVKHGFGLTISTVGFYFSYKIVKDINLSPGYFYVYLKFLPQEYRDSLRAVLLIL